MISNSFFGPASVRQYAADPDANIEPTTVKTSPAMKDGLRKIADVEGKGMSTYIRDAIRFYQAFGPRPYDPDMDWRMRIIEDPRARRVIAAMALSLIEE